MLLTTISALTASFVYDTLKEKGRDFLLEKGMDGLWDYLNKNKESFKGELTDVIKKTAIEFGKSCPDYDSSQIPFYKSQCIVDELVKFTFTSEIDVFKIKQVLDQDERIIAPSTYDIEVFLRLFRSNIESNSKLNSLYVNENYKNEIFNISQQLSAYFSKIDNRIEDIQKSISRLDNTHLVQEWIKQLDEINDDYRKLKHTTALSRVSQLRKRMEDSGIVDKSLIAKTFFLEAMCSIRYFSNEFSDKICEYYLRAYTLVPTNTEYQAQAAVAYLYEQEIDKAKKLADTLLGNNENDLTGWLVRCYTVETDLLNYIEVNVPEKLKKSQAFQLNIANKLLSRQQFSAFTCLLQGENTILQLIKDEPQAISYKNIGYWSVWTTNAIVYYFSCKKEFNTFSISGDAYDPIQLKSIMHVTGKILSAVKNTEIEEDFYFLKFQYHYIKLLENYNSYDLSELEFAHDIIRHEEKYNTITFQYIRALATSEDQEKIEKALSIIDNIPNEHNGGFLLFKISYYQKQKRNDKVVEIIKQYYRGIEVLDELNVANIIQLFSFYVELEREEAIKELKAVAKDKTSKFSAFNQLLEIQALIAEKKVSLEDLKSQIDSLSKSFTGHPDYLLDNIARCYIDLQLLEVAGDYLESYVNVEILNDTTLIYCDVLFQLPHKRIILQNILLFFRNKGILLPHKLINYDLTLSTVQNNNNEIKEICLYALKFFPASPVFLYNLIACLHRLKDKGGISQYLEKLYEADFSNNIELAKNISQILFRNDFKIEAIEFIYELSKDNRNWEIHEYYALCILTTPSLRLPIAPDVQLGCTVIYTIDGKEYKTEITSQNIETPLAQQLVGRKTGDVFDYNRSTFQINSLTIKEIVGKFQTLLNNILKDIENPLNGFAIKQFSVVDDNDQYNFEHLHKELITQFGVEEDIRRSQIRDFLELYYQGKITFSILARDVFKGNCIDCYLYLISNQAKLFRLPASYLYSNTFSVSNNTFVLDIPTLLFIFQLENEHSIRIGNFIYVIPETTKLIIDELIFASQEDKGIVGSLRVSNTGIQSFKIGEDYHEERILFFDNLRIWIDDNCITTSVPERIKYITDFNDYPFEDMYFQSVLDCLILSNRSNHVLIASEMFYFSEKTIHTNEIISLEYFVKQFLSSSLVEQVIDILLKKNVVGLTLNEDILKKAFVMRGANQSKFYEVCLENLSIRWTGYINISPAIYHIRWICMSGIFSESDKLRYIEEVFYLMLSGIHQNPNALTRIFNEIDKNFIFLTRNQILLVRLGLFNSLKSYG